MSQDVAGRPSLEAFRRGYLVSNEQFNRHNFESAFIGFDDDMIARV